ncbi:MAG: ribosome recycling factor [Oscillospiraceae bacterium]|nr:ribosome recycling factor [Oscillospiraceae bacterium]
MAVKDEYRQLDERMRKAVEALRHNLSLIRAGRANTAVLEKVAVEYYGTLTPISQLCNVTVPEARTIVIQPWEAKIIKDVEKAIQKSDIGINPISDGKVIRLSFPPLTEERRKELTKNVRKEGEDAKVAVRAIRRDAIEGYKADKKSSKITEDDLKETEKELQVLTDKYVAEVDKVTSLKEKELMEV